MRAQQNCDCDRNQICFTQLLNDIKSLLRNDTKTKKAFQNIRYDKVRILNFFGGDNTQERSGHSMNGTNEKDLMADL